MKHLIVVSHFNPKSLTFAVEEQAQRIYAARGDSCQVADLYAAKFNPVYGPQDVQSIYFGESKPADVQRYQDLILWADHLLFIYPLWWTGFPAILKGFIDRVFTSGFAISYEDGRLKGLLAEKTATLITLTGMPSVLYDSNGMTNSLIQTSDQGVFETCGIRTTHIFHGDSMSPDDSARKRFLESLEDKL